MIRVLLCGCFGKMGQTVTRIINDLDDVEVVAGVDPFPGATANYPIYTNATDVTEKIDVCIDFSHISALDNLLEYCIKENVPVIISTTGHSEAQLEQIEAASKKIPVFKSGNMSIGINLITELIQQATKALGEFFDVEIIEKHHNKKIDAPSGTALMLADAVNEAANGKYNYVFERQSKREQRSANELGIHAVRGGTIVGEHEVIFAGTDEIIEIKHTALSKEIFAVGAVKAAKYLIGKPAGYYTMKNVVNDAQ